MLTRAGWLVALLCAGLGAPPAQALDPDEEEAGFERTPPRLALVDGGISFRRPGGEGWTPALANTALSAGDELRCDADARLELQIGPRAFARAGDSARLALSALEPELLGVRLDAGLLALDLRGETPRQAIEIATPNATLRVESAGAVRVDVDAETTVVAVRRGGRVRVLPAQGEALEAAAGERVEVAGLAAPRIARAAAPGPDAWDRWSDERSDAQLEPASARYVSSDVYGIGDLDRDGDWRVVPTYGAVWVPRGLAVGWVPYSTGRWIYDPYYGWTWVDLSRWGWAPYHYGRWVYVAGRWGWCPGPSGRRVYYAPALVAFYGGRTSVALSTRPPQLGWVALGWGEPLLPWWGPPSFRRRAHWAGWGGPRVVNGQPVTQPMALRAHEISYQNAGVRDALVVVERDRFGRVDGAARFGRARAQGFAPLRSDSVLAPRRAPPGVPTRDSRVQVAPPRAAPPRVTPTRVGPSPRAASPERGLAAPPAEAPAGRGATGVRHGVGAIRAPRLPGAAAP